jgi:ribonuclease HII
VAAAVVLREDIRIKGLRDSKKVPEKEREVLFWDVLCTARQIGVGVVEHDEIDRLNILQSTKLAMAHALADLDIVPDMLVIDAVTLPSVPIRQISPFKAESVSASVAAASIVAKYVRDSIMLRYHEIYPQYNFKKHKGYGTQEHLDLIRLYGPCAIHRKSYAGVMSLPLF